ncbi:hypothetical protein ACFQZ4_34910 [Catellatospora coxensis]|uniref:Uncharacterized protein n=1 Tax=Catellatospora coxensis TaxID=310354 RepID=A0A8J3KUS0_9ACTN|nr:hypothetical protein [Catellatospora coxensis]GIG06637.1 hypothetical protein Cco03nite_33370 [Catellatospora coxensis]
MLDFETLLTSFLFCLVLGLVLIAVAGSGQGRGLDRRERGRKRREADLAAAELFYAVQGEFHGAWQEWTAVRRQTFRAADREQHRWTLFGRAAAAEARVEALVTRLATERHLTDRERVLLGCYRQAYRTLGSCLEADLPLGVVLRRQPDGGILPADHEVWAGSQTDSMLTFTELATAVGALIAASGVVPPESHARASMRVITSDEFESPAWVPRARTALDESPSGRRG